MAKEVGKKIFDHLQMIQYYRYLKEYDESYESVFKHPKPIELEGQADPELPIQFINDWERKYAKDHTKDWKLEDFKSDRIKKSEFVDLFSRYCTNVEVDDELKFGRPFFEVHTTNNIYSM